MAERRLDPALALADDMWTGKRLISAEERLAELCAAAELEMKRCTQALAVEMDPKGRAIWWSQYKSAERRREYITSHRQGSLL